MSNSKNTRLEFYQDTIKLFDDFFCYVKYLLRKEDSFGGKDSFVENTLDM